MNQKNAILFGLRIGCAVCALIAEILQICAVLFQYEDGTNYFQSNAILPVIAVGFVILAVVLGFASAIMTGKDTLSKSVFSQKPILSPAAVGFLAAVVCIIVALANGDAQSSTWTTLIILCSFVAAFYSAATEIPSLRQSGTAIAFAGFFAVFTCIFFIAYYYFDLTVEMNAPVKIATQMGLLAAMIYLVTEIRFLLGSALPRFFLALAFALVSIGTLSALTVPIALIAGKIDRVDYLAGALLTLSISISALIRIYRLLTPHTKATAAHGKDSI